MAVTRLDSAASAAAESMAYSVSTGTDRALLVWVAVEDTAPAQPTSVTYGGQSMTQVDDVTNTGGTDCRIDLYWLDEAGIAAASGTTIAVTHSVATTTTTIHAASYRDASQDAPTNTTSGISGGTGDLDTDITPTQDGSVVAACAVNGLNTVATWTSPLTEQTDRSAGGTMTSSMGDLEQTTTALVTCKCVFDNRDDSEAILAVVVEPLSGVTGTLDGNLPLPTASLSGTVTGTITGSLAGNLPVPTASLAGTVTSVITGTLAGNLPIPTAILSGTVTTLGQGAQDNAKQDTDFFGSSDDGTMSEMAVDLSGAQEDIANTAAAYMYTDSGSASARFGVDGSSGGRCIECVVELQTGDEGTILKKTSATATDEYQLYTSLGVVYAYINNKSPADQIPVTLPSFGSATEYAIQWTSYPNRDTTGPSDAVEHILFAENMTTGECAKFRRLTAAFTPDSSSEFVVGAEDTSGTDALPSGTFRKFRFSTGRPHSTTELHEDFVSRSSVPSSTSEVRVEPLVPDRSCGIGDDGEFAGPVHSIVADAVRRNDLLLASPLVNEVYKNLQEHDETFAPTQWKYSMIGDSEYTMMGQYLWYRPVPITCNKARCRVHVKTWVTSGSPLKFECRVVSMNKLPTLGQVSIAPVTFEQYHVTQSLTVDHGEVCGSWLDFTDLLKLSMDAKRCTYLALAFSIDDGNGGSTFRFEVNAVTIDPVADKSTNGLVDEVSLAP